MKRYIDTDEFEKRIRPYDTDDHMDKALYNFAHNKMMDTPTADVRENVHAKWLPYEFGNKRWHKCSACGIADEYINERGIEAVRKFCPNCGAEMEGSDAEIH